MNRNGTEDKPQHLEKRARQLLTAYKLPTIVLWDGGKRELGTRI
jgi:hypothetical protein